MKIHEYQAKELLSAYGIPVPRGGTAAAPEKARGIAAKLAGGTVVKAQIHAGGRGKGGGVKPAASPEEAHEAARSILGMQLVTHQTGPAGKKVRMVLVEEASALERELYLSLVVDRSRGTECVVFMASEAGGMEIEQVAAAAPEKIIRCAVHPATGFSPFQAR
ncbi:MAG: ATP-grasp domain-containing protein, partial [Syntrophales bacterium]